MIAYITAHCLMFAILGMGLVLIGLMVVAADMPEPDCMGEYPEEDK